jgi:hypothetical protein
VEGGHARTTRKFNALKASSKPEIADEVKK